MAVPAFCVLGAHYSKSYSREGEWRIHHPLGRCVEEPSSLEPSCEINFLFVLCYCWGFSRGSVVKNLPADNAGDTRDSGSIPGLGRSTGRGNGNPLQYSCLENSMHKEAWWAAVQAWWAAIHWVAESDTTEQLSIHCYCWASSVSLSLSPLPPPPTPCPLSPSPSSHCHFNHKVLCRCDSSLKIHSCYRQFSLCAGANAELQTIYFMQPGSFRIGS